MVISCEVGIKGEQIDTVASQLVYFTLKLPTLLTEVKATILQQKWFVMYTKTYTYSD